MSNFPQATQAAMGQVPFPSGTPVGPTGAIAAATQTCFRQQERLYILTVDLKGLIDAAFGSAPDSASTQGPPSAKPSATLHQLDAAQQGIDVVIDDLAKQINRLRSL